MDWTDAVGWLGAGLLVVAYAMAALSDVSRRPGFHLLNLIGSAGLLANGMAHNAWPVVALNSVWFVTSVVGLVRTIRQTRETESVS